MNQEKKAETQQTKDNNKKHGNQGRELTKQQQKKRSTPKRRQ